MYYAIRALLNTHHWPSPTYPIPPPPSPLKPSVCFPESIVSHGSFPLLFTPPSLFPFFSYQSSCYFLCPIRKSREMGRRRKGGMKGGKQKGEWTMRDYGLWETNWGLQGWGGGWARLVMGIKEGTYYMVHWVLYASNESWNFTSKTGDVLYGD